MINNHWKLVLSLLAIFVAAPAKARMAPEQVASLPKPASRKVDFAAEIKPILESRCINCHGRGRAKGSFRIDSRDTLMEGGDSGAVVALGKSHESLLIELVSGINPDNVMPQKGSRLTAEQISLLRAWIDQGAQWDPSVNFARRSPLNLKPRPEVLKLTSEKSGNPIDQLLSNYYRSNNVAVRESVSDRTYARRVYLDLIGVPPTPEELQNFIKDPNPADKRQRLVTRLLSDDRRYAEHWLTFWNDLLRNDYRGTGYIDGGRKQITPWLFSALSTNLPYDQFVAQLINPTEQSAGFSRGIIWRGVVNASQTPEMQAAQNIAQVFMGVNLKCASCHDSFINDWRLDEAYGLAAVYHDGPLEMFKCDKPTGSKVGPAFIFPELGQIDQGAEKAERLKRLAAIVISQEDGRLSRTIVNRIWAKLIGRGLVEPVDEMDQPAWSQDVLDWLSEDLVRNGYNLKKTLECILTSHAYQLPAVAESDSSSRAVYVFRGPQVRRLTAEQFRDSVGQLAAAWYEKASFEPVTDSGTNNASPNKVIRSSLVPADPLLTALGRPNRDQVVTVRLSSPTTLQALELTNGDTLARVLEKGAQRWASSAKSTPALVARMFAEAYGREPADEEQKTATEWLGNDAQPERIADLLWAVVMTPEFQLVY